MWWIWSFCLSTVKDNSLINLLTGLYCTAIHYFQEANWLSAWSCICINNWYTWLKYILSVTQELLFAARDEYARQINSYVQPYAIYELGCIFLAKSEVCLLHTTFILKYRNEHYMIWDGCDHKLNFVVFLMLGSRQWEREDRCYFKQR